MVVKLKTMKFNVEVDPDESAEEIKAMADKIISELTTKYLPYLLLAIGTLAIIFILTTCCGAYLALWLHRSCHGPGRRCCFSSSSEQQRQKERESWLYYKDKDEICM